VPHGLFLNPSHSFISYLFYFSSTRYLILQSPFHPQSRDSLSGCPLREVKAQTSTESSFNFQYFHLAPLHIAMSFLSQYRTLVLSGLLLAQSTVSIAARNCYVTSGPDGNQTYNNYAFYDFRSLGQNAISTPPQLPQDPNFNNDPRALATSPYFNSTDFTDNFVIENFVNQASPGFPVTKVNTALAVLIGKKEGSVLLKVRLTNS
jgi:hypothetical protein